MDSSGTSRRADIEGDIGEYIPLHRAILSNNWQEAKEIFDMDKAALTAHIDYDGHTPLHIAIRRRKPFFAFKILGMIEPELLLTLTSYNGCTVLHTAASVGDLRTVIMLKNQNEKLLFVVDRDGDLPINKAIINFHVDAFKYLLEASQYFSKNRQEDGLCLPFEGIRGAWLLTNVIFAGEFEIAYNLLNERPYVATTWHHDMSALQAIASKSDAYLSREQYNFYQRFLYSHILIKNRFIDDAYTIIKNQERDMNMCRRSYIYLANQRSRICAKFWELARFVPLVNKIYQDKKKHTAAVMLLKCICKKVGELTNENDIFLHYYAGFNLAVENDTPEAIEAIIQYFPQPTSTSCEGYLLSQNAIINRSEKVYNISVEHAVYDNKLRTCIDNEGNNLLHLAGLLAPIHKLNEVSGAALQMQREFQWFKVVEKFVFPSERKKKNHKKHTPMTVFREQHKDLRKDGEEWMKKTAESYTITAALIITIAFAAAITVPGGNSDDTGKAIFEKQPSFIVFVVSDAISLFTSSTSLLLFLSVLTARYREEDFLYSLPKRIILGLVMLFFSVTSMIVAFSATLYLLFGQEKAWILISLAALTCMPIASFLTLQFPLLIELIHSTYCHGIYSKKSDYRIK